MSCYEKNIACLKKRYSSLPGLLNPALTDNTEIIKTRTEYPSLRYKNILLHSQYDPVKESEGIGKGFDLREKDKVLLYGFGLGYHIRYILDILGKEGKLYVIELNREVFSSALSLLDQRDILSRENLEVIISPDQRDLMSQFSRIFSSEREAKEIKVLIHPPSFRCIPDGFEDIKNAFEVLMLERRTPRIFEKIERRNFFKNIDMILKSPGVKRLYGRFKNIPGIVIGAGPSLDAAVHDIKRVQKQVLIVCVDAALSSVLEEGIIPDFIVTIDPQSHTQEHFLEIDDLNIPLIFTPTSNYQILQRHRGEKFVAIKKDHFFLSAIEEFLKEKGITVGGGSVSCVALDLLISFGSNPIVLAGVDCAFPWKRNYSIGTSRHIQLLSSIDQLNTLESLYEREIVKEKIVYVKDQFGKSIPTHQNLYSYLRAIEEIIEANKDRTVINLSSKGALIRGTKNLSRIKEILSSIPTSLDKGGLNHLYEKKERLNLSLKKEILGLIN